MLPETTLPPNHHCPGAGTRQSRPSPALGASQQTQHSAPVRRVLRKRTGISAVHSTPSLHPTLLPCPDCSHSRIPLSRRPFFSLLQHLTDFSSESAPKISVCSAADLIAVSPADIIGKLRVFFILVLILFGAMHLSALVAARRDAFDASVLRGKLLDPQECRFQMRGEGDTACWTWRLEQVPSSLFSFDWAHGLFRAMFFSRVARRGAGWGYPTLRRRFSRLFSA